MVGKGTYREELKGRIAGDKGHLSNYQSALALLEHASPDLSSVFLSHLSLQNNHPDIALRTFRSMLHERNDMKDLNLSLTFPDKPTPLFSLGEQKIVE